MGNNREQMLRQELLKRELSSRQQNNSQEINSQNNELSGIDKFKQATGIDQSNIAQNFTGGMINSLQSLFKGLPDLAPETGRNPFLYEKGKSPVDTFDAYKFMGTTDQPLDTPQGAVQTAGELFTPGKAIQLGGKALKKGASVVTDAFKKVKPEKVGESIQATHDALEAKANDVFDAVQNQVQERGIGNVKIDKNLITEMESYLPKTRASKDLIEKTKTGDYSSLRKAQSELWHRGTARRSSQLPSERDIGEEILDLREKINESIANHFSKSGHEDLNKLLNQGRKYWRDLKETYFGEHVPNSISNLVQKNFRKIPDDLMKTLSENSIPMERIRSANPFVIENLENLSKKELSKNRLKNLGIAGSVLGGGAGVAYGGKKALNALTE